MGIPEIIETVSATSLSEISTNSLSSIVVLNLLLIEAILFKIFFSLSLNFAAFSKC